MVRYQLRPNGGGGGGYFNMAHLRPTKNLEESKLLPIENEWCSELRPIKITLFSAACLSRLFIVLGLTKILIIIKILKCVFYADEYSEIFKN